MLAKPMTAIALVLALGATPLTAQETGDAGADGGAGAGAGAEAGAGADAGAGAEAGAEADAGAEAGAEADTAGADTGDADAGDTADAGADTGADADADAGDAAEADADADADAGATAEGDPAGTDTGSSETPATTAVEDPTGSISPSDTATATGDDVAPDAVRAELGTLTCELEAVTNLLVYAEESFGCLFTSNEGVTVAYEGKLEKLGANLQLKTGQTLQWIVLSSVTAGEPEDLSGSYVGASAQASLGVGGGANVLIGGSGDNFTLQPISVTGQEGLGASLTIDSLTLERAPL